MTSAVMDLLRESTAELHTSAEANQFQHQLGGGRVTKEDLGRYLQQIYLMHNAIGDLLRREKAASEALSLVVQDYHLDLTCVLNDLAYLEHSSLNVTPLKATLAIIESMNETARTCPSGLLGYLYVLEGSTNGAKFIAKALRSGLSLPENKGASYFDRYGSAQRERWNAFKQAMNDLTLSDSEKESLVVAAKKTFHTFGKVGEELVATSVSMKS